MNRIQLRVITFGLLAGTLVGCSGPKLYLENARITAFNRSAKTVSWTADVTNSSSGGSWFCKRTSASGWITMQAWLTQSTDLDELPRIPAGGLMVVPDGGSLAIGETKTGGLSNVRLASSDLSSYTYLIIEAYTKVANAGFPYPGDTRKNTYCARYAVRQAVPLP
jgi:hypothetical protein